MFKYIYYLGHDSDSIDKYKYVFRLVDTDFECQIIGEHIVVEFLVAEEYEKRNLNVAANLVLYYKCFDCIGDGFNDIKRINYQMHPELSREFYKKYLPNIQKYMSLV